MANRFTALFGAQDMTVGKPMTNLLKFSIPLLIGNFAQQLYSTVDAIIVGNAVGDNALAAVGASGPVINLLLVLFMAISTGAGIMVAQYFGAKQRDPLSRTIGTSVVLIVLSSLVITIIGVTCTPALMRLLDTPSTIYGMSCDYLRIIFLGIIGAAFYNIISGILRGLGDSVWPLAFLLVATVLNTILDLVFVKYLDMGVAGAAWATIIAEAVSAALCIIRLFQMRDIVDLNRKNLRLDRALSTQLLRLGLPAGVTQGIFSLAMVLVQRLSNLMGPMVIATSTAVMRVDGFAMLPNFTFGMAASTFVGQNIGAKRLDRVEQGSKDALKLTMIASVALSALLIFFGVYLVRMFSETEAVAQLGARFFKILALGYIAVGVQQVYGGIMRGAGDTMPSMWISLFTSVALRLPIAYLWAHLTKSEQWPAGSPDALYFSLLISWVVGAIASYLWYRRGKWRERSII